MPSQFQMSYYVDTGCSESPLCTECPLPKCKFDEPGAAKGYAEKAELYERVFELKKKGVPLPELRRAFKLSERTAYRIIQTGGKMKGPKPQGDLANTPPKVDPCELMPNNFKPYTLTGPSFHRRPRQAAIYSGKCRQCRGDVRVDFRERTAICIQCGTDNGERR